MKHLIAEIVPDHENSRRSSFIRAAIAVLVLALSVNASAQTVPTVTTGSATNVTANGATLSGTVTPNGGQTSAVFEYGPSVGYGSSLSADTIDDHSNALEFNDADSNDVTTADSINLAYSSGGYTSFTIEAWAKRNANGTADCIVGQGASSLTDQKDLYFGFEGSSGGNAFRFTFLSYSNQGITTSVAYTDTLWHQWVGVWNLASDYLYLYEDGHLVASAFDNIVDQTDAPIVIGRDAYDNTSYFNGEIGEVRIWGAALDSTTIQEWMNRNVTSSHPYYSSLLAEWVMNEGSGATVGDSSGHGDNGTIARAGWVKSGWSAPVENSTGAALNAGQIYHYRLTATNSAGTTNGIDSAFTTIGVPSVQASNLTFSGVGRNSATLSWSDGNGSDRIVIVRADSSEDGSNTPADGAAYTANTVFGSGSEVGTNAFVVYVGSGNTVTVTNLPGGNYITAEVYELNGLTDPVYDTSSPAESTFATTAPSYSTKPDSALYFNGSSSYVDIQNSASATQFNLQGSFTIEGWFKTDGSFGSQSWIPIMTKGNNAWRIQRYNQTDHLDFGTSGLSEQDLQGLTSVDDSKWHFVAAVYDPADSTKYLYVDGNVDAVATSVTGTLSTDGDDVAIGNNLGATNGYFNGDVDEVRIYNTARTETQIRSDMFSTMTGVQNGLVSYWQFSEGGGTSTADSVSGFNGTLVNSPSWVTSDAPVGLYGAFDRSSGADSVGASGAVLTASITSTPDSSHFLGLYSYGSTEDSVISSETFPAGVDKRSAVVWGIYGIGSSTANVALNYSGFAGIQNETTLKVLERAEADSSWINVTSSFTQNTSNHTFTESGISSFGQFAIGAGTDNKLTSSSPTTQASNLTFSNVGRNSATLSWTDGNGADRIVVMRNYTAMDTTNIPTDGRIYTASSTYGNGSEIGSGGFVVYSGSGNSVTVTGLTAGNYYSAEVFELNDPASPKYLTTSPAEATHSTTTPAYSAEPGTAVHCFSGSSSYIEISNSGSASQFKLGGSFTVEGWFKTDGSFTSGWEAIVNKGDNAWRIQRYNQTDNLDFGTSGLSEQDLQGTTVVDDGNWHFFAAVYDNSDSMKDLYVDGRIDASAKIDTGSLATDTVDVTIGSNLEQAARVFSGDIDEVRIWDVARTEQQIRSDMFSTTSGPQSGLISYWQFNEGTGTTTADSVSGFNGTLVDSPTWVTSGAPEGGYGSYDATASTDSVGLSGSNIGAALTTSPDSLDFLGLYEYGSPSDTAVTGETFPSGVTERSPVIWGIFAVGKDTANVTLDYGSISNIVNRGTLHVLEREEADSPWVDVTAQFVQNTSGHTFTKTGDGSFSQFSIGAGADNSLSVLATDFNAITDAGSVTLSWKTQSEVGNAGFNILRQQLSTPNQGPATADWKLIASYTNDDSLRGLGTSSTGMSYRFTDDQVASGVTYSYKIQSVSVNGTTRDLSTLSLTVGVPKTYALYQNFPNPFNPSTTIRFDLKEQSNVTLEICNVLGQKVEFWDYGMMNAGRYNEDVNMVRFASGVYLYRIVAQGKKGDRFVSIKKLVLIK
jgi:Concanavalin A-like lectin/glucanases superfamily/Secretion system C-terminal sorting domain